MTATTPSPETTTATDLDALTAGSDEVVLVKGQWVSGQFEGHYQRPTRTPNPAPDANSRGLDDVTVLHGVVRDAALSTALRFFEARPGEVVHTRRIKGAWICLGDDGEGRARVHKVTLRNVTFEHFEAEVVRENGNVTLGNIHGTIRGQVFPPARVPWLLLTVMTFGLALVIAGLIFVVNTQGVLSAS